MNNSEDLALKYQKVNLAIAEVSECPYDTEKQRRLKIQILNKIKNAIVLKSEELKIDLKVA